MSSASGSFGYVINGGTSSSNLQGSNFNDSITGNSNSDVLAGGEGADTIVGGSGADIVNLEESTPAADHFRAEGSSSGADNTDVDNIVTGFTAANDVFDFADATGAYNGTAARTGFASGALGNANGNGNGNGNSTATSSARGRGKGNGNGNANKK